MRGIYFYENGVWRSDSPCLGVRPIVTLSTDLKAIQEESVLDENQNKTFNKWDINS